MQKWILSDPFWSDLIGTKREAKAATKKYSVPGKWRELFWGEWKK